MQLLPIRRMHPVEQNRMKEIVLQIRNTAV